MTSWWPWNVPKKPDSPPSPIDALVAETDATILSWSTSPTRIAAASAAASCAITIAAAAIYRRHGVRLRGGAWVTPQWTDNRRWIRGVVTSVGDGDNFRLFHTSALGGYRWPLKLRGIPTKTKDLTNETIHIRLAGVDAPENAHFGREAQPYGKESMEWLRTTLLGKRVVCQLIHKDQYSRVVSNVYLLWPFVPGWILRGTNVSREMLITGHGVVYEQKNAVYGKYGVEKYREWEQHAKNIRIGQWSRRASKHAESPAEYKKRHAKAAETQDVVTNAS